MEFLIPISMFFCIAAVMILRPLTKQLGRFLEAMTTQKTQPQARPAVSDSDMNRTLVLLEHVVKRLDAMEDRLDFAERLMAGNQRPANPAISAPRLSVHDMSDIGLRQETLHSSLR